MSEKSPTSIERLTERTRLSSNRYILIVGLVLMILPVIILWLEGDWDDVFNQRYWRGIFVQPVIIIYILILIQIFTRMDVNVIKGLRSIVQLDEAEIDQLVDKTKLGRRNGLLAFIIGAVIGLLLTSPWEVFKSFSWLGIYLTIPNFLMFGLLGWVIYTSVANTRLPNELYRQPLAIDIFDLTPFEPIGKQSLAISLAFVGGITISLLFSDISTGIFTFQFWAVYIIIILAAALIFFMNMYPTHRILSGAKKQELDAVEGHLVATYRELKQLKAENKDAQTAAVDLNAWKISQELLGEAKTWPYSIETLRKLSLAVLIPGGTALIRLMIEIFLIEGE